MALLLLRHALSISDNEGNDDDASTMFSVSLVFSLYLPLSIIVVALAPCVDFNFCSYFCCELLGFYCLAISWHGSSVFCIAGDNNRYALFGNEGLYVGNEQNYVSCRHFIAFASKYASGYKD